MMMKILNTVFKALHVVVLIGKQDVDFSSSRCNKWKPPVKVRAKPESKEMES